MDDGFDALGELGFGVEESERAFDFGRPDEADGARGAVDFLFVGAASFALFKLLDLTIGNRVDRETEIKGLDVPEMGIEAYPGFDTWLTEFGLVNPGDGKGDAEREAAAAGRGDKA